MAHSTISPLQFPSDAPMTWFFGYGSLMWKPGFSYVEREPALLRGYHRWFCSVSVTNRGTPEEPGMMINLVPGGSCLGVAYRVADESLADAQSYLDKREGEGRANRRTMLPVKLMGGLLGDCAVALENAWTYLPMVCNKNYVGVLPLEEMLPKLCGGRGKIGTSYEYLRRVLHELHAMHANEPALEELLRTVEAYRACDKSARERTGKADRRE